MAVERDKSRRECMLLRMSTRDSVPLSFIENIDSQVVKFIFPANVKVWVLDGVNPPVLIPSLFSLKLIYILTLKC